MTPPQPTSSMRAVVIGIDRFDHVNTFKPLKRAEADAKGFADMLKALGWEDVLVWLGSEHEADGAVGASELERAITRAGTFRALLRTYFQSPTTSPETFVVFYYAGHGFLGDVHMDRGYLALPGTQEAHLDTAIAMDFIVKDLVLDSPAQRVVAVLDCCHSGAAFRESSRGDSTYALVGQANFDRFAQAQKPADANADSWGKIALAACRSQEIVIEEEAYENGVPTGRTVFNYAVCEGWLGAAAVGFYDPAQKRVTPHSLKDYLSETRDVQKWRSPEPLFLWPKQGDKLVLNWRPKPRSPRSRRESAPIGSPYLQDKKFSAWSYGDFHYILPKFAPIPNRDGTSFEMGSSRDEVASYPYAASYENEFAQQTNFDRHPVVVPGFHIATYPVTVAEYTLFLAACDENARKLHTPPDWQRQRGMREMPVVSVTLHDARAYCRWLSSITGEEYILPSEAQWEKAARWGPKAQHSLVFSFGDTWTPDACNFLSGSLESVGGHPSDMSRYDVHDLAGNVQEWTDSPLLPYPFSADAAQVVSDTDDLRVVRGASFTDDSIGNVRAACRRSLPPDKRKADLGFRLVLSDRVRPEHRTHALGE